MTRKKQQKRKGRKRKKGPKWKQKLRGGKGEEEDSVFIRPVESVVEKYMRALQEVVAAYREETDTTTTVTEEKSRSQTEHVDLEVAETSE